MKNARLVIVICATFALLGTMLMVGPVYAPPLHVGPTRPFKTIQSAVSWVPSYYSWPIIVDAGIYPESVVIKKSGITIVGSPGAILDGSQINQTGFELVGTNNDIINGFIIRNYTLAGIWIHKDWVGGIASFGNTVKNCTIEWNCGHGIAMSDSHLNTIKGNTIQYNGRIGGHGAFIDNGQRNTIKDNTIYKNKWSGLEYHIAPGTQVIGNNVTYNGGDGLNADGYSPNSNIKGNTFNYNGLRGIFVISDSNIMKNNTVNYNVYSGICMAQGDYNWVEKNYVNWNGQDGIWVTHFLGNPSVSNTITNNTANHNVLSGIDVSWGANLPGLDLVEKNEVAWNGLAGINIGASSYNTIRWNHVHDNAGIGVFIDNGGGAVILGNYIHNNGGSGIEYHIAAYTQVVDNTVIYNGRDGLNADGYSGGCYIHVNRFDNNGWNGIFMISGSNTITNNYANNNGLDGIRMWQIGSNLIDGNQANNNGEDGIRIEWESYNLIQNNEASNNYEYGIVMGSRYTGIYATYNTMYKNTALNNISYDLAEDPLAVPTNNWNMGSEIIGPMGYGPGT